MVAQQTPVNNQYVNNNQYATTRLDPSYGYSYPTMQQVSNEVVLQRVNSLENINQFYVPPGTSGMFIHNTKPYMFIKTAPSSPLSQPSLETYKLVKVDSMDDDEDILDPTEELRREVKSLKERIAKLESIRSKPAKTKFYGKPKHTAATE